MEEAQTGMGRLAGLALMGRVMRVGQHCLVEVVAQRVKAAAAVLGNRVKAASLLSLAVQVATEFSQR